MKIIPSQIAESLLQQMKLSTDQKEMESIWNNYKNTEQDINIVNAVENYFYTYYRYYFYWSLEEGLVGCIAERILGQL